MREEERLAGCPKEGGTRKSISQVFEAALHERTVKTVDTCKANLLAELSISGYDILIKESFQKMNQS